MGSFRKNGFARVGLHLAARSHVVLTPQWLRLAPPKQDGDWLRSAQSAARTTAIGFVRRIRQTAPRRLASFGAFGDPQVRRWVRSAHSVAEISPIGRDRERCRRRRARDLGCDCHWQRPDSGVAVQLPASRAHHLLSITDRLLRERNCIKLPRFFRAINFSRCCSAGKDRVEHCRPRRPGQLSGATLFLNHISQS
jgi:hypothetical protein